MDKKKKNCWEFQKCGREPGGNKVDELGVCPAATSKKFDKVNGGENAGRFCWVMAGTLCQGEVQGTFAKKFMNCLSCSFYQVVEREEDRNFVLTEKRIIKEDF